MATSTGSASFLDDPVARDESLREGAQIIDEMLRFPLPVIAAVNGPAVGLGCSIATLCDITLVADTAYLADPHVPVGLVAGDGGAAFWPLLTPILRSREYLFTGDRIPAATAVELGLATRVVPATDLMEEALRLAGRLARQPREALEGTKRVVNMHLAGALGGAVPAGFAAEAGHDADRRAPASPPRPPRLRRPAMSPAVESAEHRGVPLRGPGLVRRPRAERLAGPSDRGLRRGVRRLPDGTGSSSSGAGDGPCPTGPREWGGGLSTAEQMVLYQELAAHDAPGW